MKVTRLDGTHKVVDMAKLVKVAKGTSRHHPGWSGTLTFSAETNSFIELSTAPPDVRGNSEDDVLEVDDSYAFSVYHKTRGDIAK